GGRLGPALPGGQGRQRILPPVGGHVVDDRGGAAHRGGGRAGGEVVRDPHGPHRQVHVGVRVDAARHEQEATDVDDLAAGVPSGFVRQVGAHRADGSVAPDRHVGGPL